MTKEQLLESFEEILMIDPGSITENTNLNELDEWDSLSKIALISLLEEKLEYKTDLAAIDKVETFTDIIKMVEDLLA